jgi:hypothetical protein
MTHQESAEDKLVEVCAAQRDLVNHHPRETQKRLFGHVAVFNNCCMVWRI